MVKRIKAICPPGFLCMDTSTMIFLLLIALSIVGGLVFLTKNFNREESIKYEPTPPQIVVVKTESPALPPPTMDPRFSPSPPERLYDTLPSRIPININTRGTPESFQQVGVITTPGGTETSGSPSRTILPLFGRVIDSNRNRWNYYTRSDGLNPVQLPLQFKRRNCDDDNGCEELSDGDSVGVPILGNSYTVSMYKYSTPRYLPMV